MKRDVTGYSAAQVALHWSVVVLIVFQFVASDAMERSWRALERGEARPAADAVLTNLHAVSGITILLLVFARIWLRVTRGAPKPPADEPWILHMAAEATHGLLYLLLLAMPVTGAVAWFGGVRLAGATHGLLTNLLLIAVFLHVGGALFQHFVRRTDVVMRMLRPQRD